MFTPVAHDEIVLRVKHIRELLREIAPATAQEQIAHERRDKRIKDFLSNLRRTRGHATVQMLDDLQKECMLTKDGGYRLFGYTLDAIREYDIYLNGGRTHIVESYVFERDLTVQLPRELASANAFAKTATLNTLVQSWQNDVPIRHLSRPAWRRPGSFYVHIGTEDSLGSSLPPGAVALTEPIDEEEARLPNPRSLYLLQFPNGYRCSRCVATRGKLQLLASDRSYRGPEEFSYPGSVRIAGRIRVFALGLPMPEFRCLRGIWTFPGNAGLILPWEHSTRWSLLATKHRRFVRSGEERQRVQSVLEDRLRHKLSERTRRRYRSDTLSEPHVTALMQMSVEHLARYSDLLRTGGSSLRDAGRFSLDTMLRATRFGDLQKARFHAELPTPPEVWDARRSEMVEYATLLALKFPQPSLWADRIVRIGEETELKGLEPHILPGSWLLLEDLPAVPPTHTDSSKRGWARPLYALRQGLDIAFGYLEREDGGFALLANTESGAATSRFGFRDLPNLRRVCGAVVPV